MQWLESIDLDMIEREAYKEYMGGDKGGNDDVENLKMFIEAMTGL